MIISDSYDKIKRIQGEESTILGEDVLAFSVAGDATARILLGLALSEGVSASTTIESDVEFHAIAVTEKTAYSISKAADSAELYILEIPEGMHYTIGSGYCVANYVMLHGADPVDAVIAAIKTDIGSGGDVTRYQREVS